VSKPTMNLTLLTITREIENVLEEYPEDLRFRVAQMSSFQQKLVAYVIHQLRWIYIVMIDDDKTVKSDSLSCSLEQRLRIRTLVRQGIRGLLQSAGASQRDISRHPTWFSTGTMPQDVVRTR
jgi:hypothetical protein